MREHDIVIVGGGLAGSLACAMLARDGFDVAMVDPHETYPAELRCEKLITRQIDILERSGFAPQVVPPDAIGGEHWVARFGRLVERRRGDYYGILYDTLVNTVRGAIPSRARLVWDKVTAIDNGPARQRVTLSQGEVLDARLVIVANGLNSGLRNALGMERDVLSKCHCITFAFDLAPLGRGSFPFHGLTYHSERPSDRVAYITMFPVGETMRANFMVYRPLADPWVRRMQAEPDAGLAEALPGLARILGPAHVTSPVLMRPADLYVTRNALQPGVVLVGDAFATSCPAAGTGTDKVFTDVERLCNVHVPRWLSTPGMDTDKIGAFYADPMKAACDQASMRRAFTARSVSIEEGWTWEAQRWARFLARMAIGTARAAVRRAPLSQA